jgi:CspA family cold shock protein
MGEQKVPRIGDHALRAAKNLISRRTVMLKSITKFVLQRRRRVQQVPHQVVEEDDTRDAASASEDLTQPAEPQLDEPSSQPVLAKVKWYNPDKRYGFVELSDGSGDDFLHATALAGIGISALQPGETLALRVAPAERGLLVTEVLSVDSSTAVQPRLSRTRFRSSSDMQRSEAAVQEMGTVKWYNAGRGFGFIVLDKGEKEAFVHASALARSGVISLREGQRVFVGVAEGRRGPEAASIQVA